MAFFRRVAGTGRRRRLVGLRPASTTRTGSARIVDASLAETLAETKARQLGRGATAAVLPRSPKQIVECSSCPTSPILATPAASGSPADPRSESPHTVLAHHIARCGAWLILNTIMTWGMCSGLPWMATCWAVRRSSSAKRLSVGSFLQTRDTAVIIACLLGNERNDATAESSRAATDAT